MKKTAFLLIISLLSRSVFGQDTWLKWARQFAGISPLNYSRGWGLETDVAGNVYSVGVFTGTVDFDPGPAVYNLTPTSTDVYISKLDSAGKFLWAKQITGSFGTLTRSFALDKDNNIYVTGTFQATVDFDLGPGIFNLTANGSNDIFILKLTKDGDFLWVKQIGDASAVSDAYSTTTDSFGSVYFTGSYKGSIDFDPGAGVFTLTSAVGTLRDAFVCKLDAAGNFIWAAGIGAAQADIGLGISADKLDNVYVTGTFSATVDFDPGPAVVNLVANGLEDMFILKLDAGGNFIWAKPIGGASSDACYKAVTDDAGNIYATGYFRSTADFDPGPAVYNLTAAAGTAIFVLKLDPAGSFVWAKAIGGVTLNTWGMDITLDNFSKVYTTGFFIGPVDFDPGPGSYNMNSAGIDAFITKLDNAGDFVWAKSLGGTNTDQGLAISVDRYLNIYTTGFFNTTTDFDLEAGTYNLTAIPVSDAFVHKVAQCASPAFSTLTVSACKSYTLNGQTYTASGTYQQTVFSTAGCDSIITLQLHIDTSVFTTVNASICPGQFYHAGGADQTAAGVYKDTLLTALGCDSIITTHLTIYGAPVPNLGPDGKLCANEQLILSPGAFSSYLWQDNSMQPTFTTANAGKYWVTVKDANNCSATDTLNILSLDTIPTNFLPANQDLCYGNMLRIAVPNYANYLWSTGSTLDFIDISNAGTYYLTVQDFNSCTGTDSITILRKNCLYIAIPNAFSPDGNSFNDVFKPTINQAIKDYHMIVFNRYGQTVFETRDYGTGWDGTFKAKKQSAGSYVYRIRYTNIFGVETVEHGSVLLIR